MWIIELIHFCRTLDKTLVYLDVFARFKDEENIKAVERLLNSHTELEMFERSQLGKCRDFVPYCHQYPISISPNQEPELGAG